VGPHERAGKRGFPARAHHLFLTEGVEGVRCGKIADRVGVTATAIYATYKDKDEISTS